jgi:2-polyprenyl-6-methoxyphenol hydroxylase-like FAD-dependent oxidoreductase
VSASLTAPVVIVGAGPVGTTLALDLAWRGIDSVVVEQRSADETPTPRANHVSARAMETFRRLAIAADVRATGLPPDYPNDVVWMTTMTGYELTRIPLACRGVLGQPGYADSGWPTPEPQHKINQMYLEPILWRHARASGRIRFLNSVGFERLVQESDRVVCEMADHRAGAPLRVEADYVVGCDGGASSVRKSIGAAFSGDAAITRVVSLHICAPDLLDRIPNRPAHRYFLLNQRQTGGAVSLNGRDRWSIHVMLPTADSDPKDLDRDRAIRAIIGVGSDFRYEIFADDAWTGRRLLADRVREGRVFLCGDAAHIWVPNAGYGMNAGIADAENLAWRLAAVVHGWGGPALLDGYERERLPITDQVSRFAKDLAIKNRADELRNPPAELTLNSPAGEAARRRFGEILSEVNLAQFTPLGLNFAYFYDDSPNIIYDGEAAPAYGLGDYTPSTVPGCRAPHFPRADGSSLYDQLGPDYTLLRFDPGVEVDGLTDAAARRGVPLTVLDVDQAEASPAYRHKLVLVRPDRHVAWRGDEAPGDGLYLIDVVTGHAAARPDRERTAATTGTR